MQAWWGDADDDPAAFRDPVSVASLVDGALSAEPAERDVAVAALCRVVKALEDDPIDESLQLVAARLPELVRGLVDPQTYYSAQVISIARRVPVEAPTVEALLQLIEATPSAEDRVLLVYVAGMCPDSAWSHRLEATLAASLAEPATFGSALEAFYFREYRVRHPETARALAKGALTAVFPATARAIRALLRLLQSDFSLLAETALTDLAAARPELRQDIAEARRERR